MRNIVFLLLLLFSSFNLLAQKKPLDHTVYDSWQSIGEKMISDDGKLVVYTITPQEGDATLVIQLSTGTKLLEIPRGYNAKIAPEARWVVCKIKPTYQQTRDAKIKKKKPEEMPKDSLAIVSIGEIKYVQDNVASSVKLLVETSIQKIAHVKSYKTPEEESNWLAWLYEKNENDKKAGEDEGTTLCLRNFKAGTVDTVKKVSEYYFDKKGNNFVLEITNGKKDTLLRSAIIWRKLNSNKQDTLLKNFADAKGFAFDETGSQLAFVSTDDTTKTEQKDFSLFKFNEAGGSAMLDNKSKGIPTKWRINENANLSFSKTGKRLFLGTSPSLPAKDTSLPEFERVSVDVWHYNDDDLQTVQLKNLDADLKRSYLARFDFEKNEAIQLGNQDFERVYQTLEGDGNLFYTTSDAGKRVARQWQGFTLNDVYAIDANTGKSTLIKKDLKGNIYPSYTGKYLLMYDERQKHYSVYNTNTKQTYAVAKDIPYALYDEESDVPDDPNAYGIVKWMEEDKYVLVYDRYDVWKVDPSGKEKSVVLTSGRKDKIQYRYLNIDQEEKFISSKSKTYCRIFSEKYKTAGFTEVFFTSKEKGADDRKDINKEILNTTKFDNAKFVSNVQKAKKGTYFIYTIEDFNNCPNLFAGNGIEVQNVSDGHDPNVEDTIIYQGRKLTSLNPQQAQYNWLTAELFKWKAYTGKETEGILYKPENFDPKKKYPMIVYFYERNNQTLYNYQAPSPTPSRLNIPFFVSRGYIVFVPDIWYKTGKPGQSAYDYIVSGTRAVVKLGFVDSTKIGLQGQSWGGYQTAQLITMTNLYKAAWAGAPVANMFSAYGGIRWESGLNRQFQYEHSQSRIGATIWQRPDLYIENSPLFHLQKVKTPLVIMANDKDGAVPWYQGIELFTAMRRLNKPVWMLNYNDEAHNLVERRNRKDIQIREQQFFDWLLKGEKPAPWLTEGVPAMMKGRTWGL